MSTYHFSKKKKKKKVEWNCGNGIAKIRGKKLFMSVCGNAIAEIGGKKIVVKKLWQCHCRKWEGKKNSSYQNHM